MKVKWLVFRVCLVPMLRRDILPGSLHRCISLISRVSTKILFLMSNTIMVSLRPLHMWWVATVSSVLQ